jgi:hypothetical protein
MCAMLAICPVLLAGTSRPQFVERELVSGGVCAAN